MDTALLAAAKDYGFIGLLLIVFIGNTFFLTRKLLSIIENNTRALVEMREIIKNSVERRKA